MFSKVENKSQWRGLLDKAPFKTFFHSLEWESFLEREFSWMKFERYIWKDGLLLSIARCRLFGKEKLVSHPFCEYGGPLPLKRGSDFGNFVEDFKKEFGPKARIKFHPYISFGERYCSPTHSRPASAGLRGSGCFAPSGTMPKQPSNPLENNTVLPAGGISTFWIEDFSKKTPEDLWNNFRKTLKQEIKKGEGFVEVGECQNENELKQFYDLYLRTVRRHKNIPLPFIAFIFFYEHTNERSMDPVELGEHTKIFLAKYKNKVIGGSIFLFYKPFIHYFISASNERFRDRNIGHQILWYVMKKYARCGVSDTPHTPHRRYDYFDLGGTRGGSALEVFKRGWGAKERLIYEVGPERAGSGASFLRNALGLIPSSVMRRLAPVALWAKI